MKHTRRTPPPAGFIIERPDLQTLATRVGGYTLTFFGWAIYLYLWLPLITLIAWWLDLGFVYEQMVVQDGLQALAELARWYALVFSILGGCYLGWARYNQWRFRGVERRRSRPAVSQEDLAKQFEVPRSVVAGWSTARRVTVHLDDEGRIVPSPRVMPRLRAAPNSSASKAGTPPQRH